MTRSGKKKRNDAYILVSVLSVLALLSGTVAALLLLTRNAVDTAAIASNRLTNEAITRSAVTLAGYQLFVLKRPAHKVNGQQIRLDQGVMSLSVSSDAGKVDLNGSGKELLAAAYQASGLRALDPKTFAARVIDWRDADDEVAADGAEAAEYSASGLSQGPRNSPFRSIDDLQWVMGLTPNDMAALRPFVTIYNPGGRLNVFAASSEIIAALPGVDAEIIDQVSAVRGVQNAASTARLADLLLVQSALIDAAPPATYRVRIDVRPNNRTKPGRTEVVIASGAMPAQAFNVLAWTDEH